MLSFAQPIAVVQREIVSRVEEELAGVLEAANSIATVHDAERVVVDTMQRVGRLLMAVVLALVCRRLAEEFIAVHGRAARFRLDRSYWGKLSTTLGEVEFPWFAVRTTGDQGQPVSLNPARDRLLGYYPACRSSPTLLRWECQVASREPFRQAAQTLADFTHGAVRQEDTTIRATR